MLIIFFLSLESSLFLYKNKDSFESEENLYFLDPYWGKLSSILLFLTIVLFFFVNMAEMAMGHGLFLVFPNTLWLDFSYTYPCYTWYFSIKKGAIVEIDFDKIKLVKLEKSRISA